MHNLVLQINSMLSDSESDMRRLSETRPEPHAEIEAVRARIGKLASMLERAVRWDVSPPVGQEAFECGQDAAEIAEEIKNIKSL